MWSGLSFADVSWGIVMDSERVVRGTCLPIMPMHATDGVAMSGAGNKRSVW